MRNPTPVERSEIDHYLSLDESSLLMHLGRSHPGASGRLFSPPAALAEGERLLSEMRTALHQLICVDWGYCEMRGAPGANDRYALIVAIAELIIRQFPGTPSVVVACLLFRLGLDQFCGCQPK